MNFRNLPLNRAFTKCALAFGVLLLIGSLNNAKAQKYEFGGFLGTSTYYGDLSEYLMAPENTRYGLGGFGRILLYEGRLALKGGVNYGRLTGNDAYSKSQSRRNRNLSFTTPVTQAYAVAEFVPTTWKIDRYRHVIPYVFGGIGVFHFNPMAQYNGQWYALQPLRTEGQGLPQYPTKVAYKLTQACYPFGFGVRYKFNPHWSIGIETQYNKTFTDYLDDVSSTYVNPEYLREYHRNPEIASVAIALSNRNLRKNPEKKVGANRGNNGAKDAFLFTGITIAYSPMKYSCYRF